jgi:NDP-sugar pyrophosphorylase family protein
MPTGTDRGSTPSEPGLRAIVLAGGRGRRLAPLTTAFPKPLAPVGELPILEIVLRQLRAHGVRRATLSLGHMGELIQAYLATRGRFVDGLEIDAVRETTPMGTAGALGLVEGTGDDDVVVVNGDILTTLDFAELMRFHRDQGAALTVAVSCREVTLEFGVVEMGAQGEVTGWREKPVIRQRCSMGINVYSPQALAAIAPGEHLEFPDLVLRLLERGERVLAYETDCYWLDIGRRDDYEQAQEDFARMRDVLLPEPPPLES